MTDVIVRFVLSFGLVVWSPAWCCCVIAAATGSESGQEQEEVAGCCAATTNVSELTYCEHSNSPCECHERPSELDRLDTAQKVSAPKQQVVQIAMYRDAIDLVEKRSRGVVCYDHLASRGQSPPQTTLFAQRSLLLL